MARNFSTREIKKTGTARVEAFSHYIGELTKAITHHQTRLGQTDAQIAGLVNGKLTTKEISAITRVPETALRPTHRRTLLELLHLRRRFHTSEIQSNRDTLKRLEDLARRFIRRRR
jgi:ribosomal protein L30/L7E